jgi:hypothetical protein
MRSVAGQTPRAPSDGVDETDPSDKTLACHVTQLATQRVTQCGELPVGPSKLGVDPVNLLKKGKQPLLKVLVGIWDRQGVTIVCELTPKGSCDHVVPSPVVPEDRPDADARGNSNLFDSCRQTTAGQDFERSSLNPISCHSALLGNKGEVASGLRACHKLHATGRATLLTAKLSR